MNLIHLSILLAILAMAPAIIEICLRKPFTVHNSGIVIITGTSSGIGRATCAHLAVKHPRVTFFCGVLAAEEGTGYPFTLDNVQHVILDVTKDEDVEKTLSKVKERGLPLIGIFNNAGISTGAVVELQDLDSYRSHFEVMPFGTYRLTHAAIPLLRESRGRIVITSSVTGLLPGQPMNSAYAGCKKALEALGDSLRKELGPLGVSVSLIEPGILDTNLTRQVVERVKEGKKRLEKEPGASKQREVQLYPHLFNKEKYDEFEVMFSTAGKMEETCEAVDDALFGKFPKIRYITSVAGPMPAWVIVKIFSMMSDRVADLA